MFVKNSNLHEFLTNRQHCIRVQVSFYLHIIDITFVTGKNTIQKINKHRFTFGYPPISNFNFKIVSIICASFCKIITPFYECIFIQKNANLFLHNILTNFRDIIFFLYTRNYVSTRLGLNKF